MSWDGVGWGVDREIGVNSIFHMAVATERRLVLHGCVFVG